MFRILHMYYDLMSLYGDWANVEVLALELRSRGVEAVIDKMSVGDGVDVEAYSFVYIGSGTERSLVACLSDIMRFREPLLGGIDNGLHVLATGNSHEIFGRTVMDSKGVCHEALGLLDFETVQGAGRVAGDCVCKASFLDDKLIGFINRASQGQEGNVQRPFENELGPGADDKSESEGIQYKNLLGTYLTGPVLVRNPPLMRYFADKLIGDGGVSENGDAHSFFAYQSEGYRRALKELLGES